MDQHQPETHIPSPTTSTAQGAATAAGTSTSSGVGSSSTGAPGPTLPVPTTPAPDASTSTSAGSDSRKRSLRACDGCRHRRMKCEDIQVSQSTGLSSCRVCREHRQRCTFDAPVRKRGPRPGYRLRLPASRSASPHPEEVSSHQTHYPHASTSDARGGSTNSTRSRSASPRRSRSQAPLLGLNPNLVDTLLAAYWTHVHNVWPLIYKPLFNPHTTPASLLLAMLAIAACIAPPDPARDGVSSDELFHRAERTLHHCRTDCRIDIIQSLCLLSLRQTGCGDKRAAFTYAGRACCMALNMGLNLRPTAAYETPLDSEVRSRVYWNCYVLDKSLAEETGRSFILPYRRSSTPLPSMTEADEYEMWPPLPNSSALLPRSVRHIIPRRGHVMSCFVWTCRLAMVVEDILDLEEHGPPTQTDQWDQLFATPQPGVHIDPVAKAEHLASKLEAWRTSMPPSLEVIPSPEISPLPHHTIGLSWYYTSQILLYSRFIKRREMLHAQTPTRETELAIRSHRLCSKAAEDCVDLFAHLDRFKLLAQASSDIIHLLSLATLFEAFDASDPDQELAHRAKLNFAQCCLWLRDFSSAWPTASAHKLFFEGLIRGGIKMLSSDIPDLSPGSGNTPHSPSAIDGLRTVGRNLTGDGSMETWLPPVGVSSFFQLPQFYWNHLTNAVPGQQQGFDTGLDLTFSSPEAMTSALADWSHLSPPETSTSLDMSMASLDQQQQQQQQQAQGSSHGQQHQHQHHQQQQLQQQQQTMDPMSTSFMTDGQQLDQSAIYSALMSYMVQAAKSC